MAAADPYDVIVVGARCAGSPTAMLLARKGYKVLVVDRATFPSDTLSTHVLHPPGVAALQRWGLLDRLVATGCPPIDTYAFDFGPFTISGAPGTDDSPVAYCPRRTVLDKLLVDARRRGRRRGPRGVHRRRGRRSTTGASSASAATARAASRVDRARAGRRRRRRPVLARRRGRRRRAVQREAADPVRLLHATGAACPMDGRFEVYVATRPRLGGRADPRRPDARRRAAGRSPSSRPTRTTSKATT